MAEHAYDLNGVVVDLAEIAAVYPPSEGKIKVILKGGAIVAIDSGGNDAGGLLFLAIKEAIGNKGVLRV